MDAKPNPDIDAKPNPENFVGRVKPITGLCVDFTNLGTNNPKLINGCGEFVLATVKNWSIEGTLISTRYFHLNRDEIRPLAFPGYEMAVSSVGDWAQTGQEDGSRFLDVRKEQVDTFVYWQVRNSNGSLFNAVSFLARQDNQRFNVVYAIPPATTVKLWGAYEDQKPNFYLNWSEIDPR